MAAPAWQTDEVNTTGTSDTFARAAPVGRAAGDLLIAHVGFEKGTDVSISTPPAGYTLIDREDQAANVGQLVYWRTADGTASDNFSMVGSTSVKYSVMVGRVTGHHASTPITTSLGANNSSGNPDPPSRTVVVDDLTLICVSAKTQTTYTAPSDYTEQYDFPNSSDGTPSLWGGTKAITGAGTEDPGTPTPGGASEWVAVTIVIASATAAAAGNSNFLMFMGQQPQQ